MVALDLGLNKADPTTLVVDLNCAFASIEQQHDPALRGRPLAIAAYATDAATIVSASREARDLGIKTGMRVFEAKAIFPSIAIKEPNPPRYRTVSDSARKVWPGRSRLGCVARQASASHARSASPPRSGWPSKRPT